MTESQKRGGKRAGAGRKPSNNVSVTVRIAKRHRRLIQLAGSKLIEEALDWVLQENKTFHIDSRLLTFEERDQFLDALKKAAGNQPEQPWWRPWSLGLSINVKGSSLEQWGASYWSDMQAQMEDVDIDMAHIAGRKQMEEALFQKLNRFHCCPN